MNKRLFLMLIGFLLIVVSVYGLYDIISDLPMVTPSKPQVGTMPDPGSKWYMSKILGTLFLACIGFLLVIFNIIGLIRDQKVN